MGIFGTILNKIFHHGQSNADGAAAATPVAPRPQTVPQTAPQASPAVAPAAPAAAQPVDVEAVLSQMAQSKGGGGNWQTSIVDLLKLLDIDSSLTARKALGDELNVHAGADGSAEQNIALQKAVMKELEKNGGRVPASLKD